jgi:hypothetical protein
MAAMIPPPSFGVFTADEEKDAIFFITFSERSQKSKQKRLPVA